MKPENRAIILIIIGAVFLLDIGQADIVIHKYDYSNLQQTYSTNIDVKYTTKPHVTEFPTDKGGNFGDLIHLRRSDNDELALREIIVNEDIYPFDAEINYENKLDGRTITTVRLFNLGRERAFVTGASSNIDGLIQVQALIKEDQQVRLLIEAYAEKL